MNKILTLYNLEFKRIYKLYFGLLLGLVGINIATLIFNLSITIQDIARETKAKASIELLKTTLGNKRITQGSIEYIYGITTMALGLAVILCLIYGVAIWYRDFIGKSKVSYTLFMLPENKFNIYIAKLITVITMIFGVMATQIVTWLVIVNIIGKLSDINNLLKVLIFEGNIDRNLNLIQLYPLDFFMINILGVILAIVVIFTAIMLQLAFKKIGIVLAIAYILSLIFIGLYLVAIAYYTDILLILGLLYIIVIFTISIILSYKLLNKKIYV